MAARFDLQSGCGSFLLLKLWKFRRFLNNFTVPSSSDGQALPSTVATYSIFSRNHINKMFNLAWNFATNSGM